MKIGFTYDLRADYLAEGYGEEETAEFDAPATIESIDSALRENGYDTDRIGHARNLIERLACGDRWDLVFNICEGLRGPAREAQVPAILDVYEIPYTFADATVLAFCLDKVLTKTIVRPAGVPTPDWHVVTELGDVESCQLAYPLIAKPIAEGTGKGINAASKVRDLSGLSQACQRLLDKFKQPVLVERFLPGREFTVGIVGTGRDAEVVATLEIKLRQTAENDVYSYLNKERSEEVVDLPLADGREPVVAEAERIALAAYWAVGARDAGRIDLRCDDDGKPQFMEINPLAGLHPTHSDLPILWAGTGRRYSELIGRIVDSARTRVMKSTSHEAAHRRPAAPSVVKKVSTSATPVAR